MPRKSLIAGNWKMHKTVAETAAYLEALLAEDLPGTVDVVCCPTMVSLPAAAMVLTASLLADLVLKVADPRVAFRGSGR